MLLSTNRIGMMSGAEPEQIAVLHANGGDVDRVFVAGRCTLKRLTDMVTDLKPGREMSAALRNANVIVHVAH